MSQKPYQPNVVSGEHQDSSQPAIKAWGLGIVGAILGAVVGWVVFGLLFNQGFYALALPGALVGLGFGKLSRQPMIAGGVFCAVFSAVLMLFCEWHHRPWIDDESLGYFMTHLQDLSFATMLFFGMGVLFAFWFGRGR